MKFLTNLDTADLDQVHANQIILIIELCMYVMKALDDYGIQDIEKSIQDVFIPKSIHIYPYCSLFI